MPRTSARMAVGSLVLVAGVLAACSSDDARPSRADLAEVIVDESLAGGASSEDLADCMATLFDDSELSDSFLRAMVEKDDDYRPSEKDTAAMASVARESATSCAKDPG